MRLLDGQLVLSPSDLTKFTRCAHVTTLDLGRLSKTLKPLAYPQRSLHTDFIAEKGTEHEKDYVERLARAGNRVLRIEGDRKTADDLRNAAQATIDAIRSGAADYIYQAVFFDGKWVGYADLLEKVGDGRYEVIDVKLARSPKAHVLLQLAAYSEHLTRIQDVRPDKMHIILGTGEKKSFRVADFEAYYRYVKSRYEQRVSGTAETSPYIIDFCSLCEWNLHCWRHLEQLDHLVRVANIRRDHVRRLEGADIKTLTKLGDTPTAHVERIRDGTYAGLHQQARLQSEYARTKTHRYELLAPEIERGFALLPRPSKGDVFLDLEADPYAARAFGHGREVRYATDPSNRHHGRRALQRAGAMRARRSAQTQLRGCASRHSRQISGPPGRGGFLLDGSSGDDLPRDIDFLFSRNRINVAISRARCLAVVVASPRLLDVACHTPEQMQLVNALCRFVEMARVAGADCRG